MNNQTELIPPTSAEKLNVHAKLIKTFIRGEDKAGQEMFGYAFLVGNQLLQAKSEIAHGNSGNGKPDSGDGQPNLGFQKWVEASFPDYTYRTAANRMTFAALISEHLVLEQPQSPLLLGVKKLNKLSRATITNLVREVMDGKGMMEFMRACRLLKDPAKPEPEPRKPLSKQEALKARIEQSKRVLQGVRDGFETARKILLNAPLDDLQQSLDASVTFSNAVRDRIKRLKGSA